MSKFISVLASGFFSAFTYLIGVGMPIYLEDSGYVEPGYPMLKIFAVLGCETPKPDAPLAGVS